MVTLGISCHYHDAAACLVRDGEILAAAEEERFDRKKFSGAFPRNAINSCVQKAKLTFDQIDRVAFYELPFLKFSRVLMDHVDAFPFSLGRFVKTMPHWLGDRLLIKAEIQEELARNIPVHFFPHHLSHAAHSVFLSGFQECAWLTLDGVGENACGSRGSFMNGDFQILGELKHPHSLGLFYSAIAEHLGFGAVGGEGKLMGLAAYGKPQFLEKMMPLISLNDEGAPTLGMNFFSFRSKETMFRKSVKSILGPSRQKSDPILGVHKDIAATAQTILEISLEKNLRSLKETVGSENLCLGGGVALNCLANGKVLSKKIFKNIFVPPGCGDAGGAVGAAYLLDNLFAKAAGARRIPTPSTHCYWGPMYSDREILRCLKQNDLSFRSYASPEELTSSVAEMLSEGKILGWFQGEMEFGPRALGNRSIFADPRLAATRDRVNLIKKRENFRPFAPIVCIEEASEYFELSQPSPFMLFAAPVRREKRESLGAVTHVDGTARVQTLREVDNPLVYKLLEKMKARIGLPILLNTSFNLDKEPMVCDPEDAVRTFLASDLDGMVIGNYFVWTI